MHLLGKDYKSPVNQSEKKKKKKKTSNSSQRYGIQNLKQKKNISFSKSLQGIEIKYHFYSFYQLNLTPLFFLSLYDALNFVSSSFSSSCLAMKEAYIMEIWAKHNEEARTFLGKLALQTHRCRNFVFPKPKQIAKRKQENFAWIQ